MTATDRNRWPSVLETGGAPYTAMTIGVMIDESVGGEINLVCPRGRVAVTSELSIDFGWPDPAGISSLICVGEVVDVRADRALAHGVVRSADGQIVATATTWCIFIDGNGQETPGFWSDYAPPPDLSLDELLEIEIGADGQARGSLQPDRRAANDLGNLHGGVLLAAMHDVGRAGLVTRLRDPRTTSVRVNYLRPGLLDGPLDLEAETQHAGRTVGLTRVHSRNAAGKITAVGTVTACAGPA